MAVKTNGFIESSLPDELLKLLFTLASKWGDIIDIDMIKVIHLSGAMTNEVYRISWPTKTPEVFRTVLVRVYGQGVDVFFDRDEEIRTFEFLSKHGQGPRLLGQFPQGRVEEFIQAKVHTIRILRNKLDAVIDKILYAKTELICSNETVLF